MSTREIPDGIAIEMRSNDELHLIDSGHDVTVEIWALTSDGPVMVYQSALSYADMVAFVRWVVPPRLHDILRQHGVQLDNVSGVL